MLHMAAIALVSLLSTQSKATPSNCKPVEGTFAAQAQKANCRSKLCTAGTVKGGLDGTYAFHTTKEKKAGKKAATVTFFVGESTVTLKDGRTLTGIDTGTIDMPPGEGGFASLITWKNGGQIRLRGVLDLAAGETRGDYQGTVCGAR